MAEQSAISWTDATHNEWLGCANVSPGCDHCYAEAMIDGRFGRAKWGAKEPRVLTSEANRRKPLAWNRQPWVQCTACAWRGPECDFCPACEGHAMPARRRVFSASLSDWLDNAAPVEWLVGLLDTVRRCDQLDFLLLSKRIGLWRSRLEAAAAFVADQGFARFQSRERFADQAALLGWLNDWLADQAPANAWIGATVVNQAEADRDIPKLLQVPARVRFLSIEPMLGAVDLSEWIEPTLHCGSCGASYALDEAVPDPDHRMGADTCARCGAENCMSTTWGREAAENGCPDDVETDQWDSGWRLHWVISGGESGPGARLMHPDWARSLRDQCAAAGVAYHHKQWGHFSYHTLNAACEIEPPIPMELKGLRMWDGQQFVEPAPRTPAGEVFRPGALLALPVGAKASGRHLDGRTHDGVAGCGMGDAYQQFVAGKLALTLPTGITGEIPLPDGLFDHQRALVVWAARRGRCAIFADTGLGKTRMEIAYAAAVQPLAVYVLILAPLAVAAQTVREAAAIGIKVRHVRSGAEVTEPGIYITNYDRLHLFDCSVFGAVIPDESSIIKHSGSKTFATMTAAFAHCAFKLCATATPAPNDWTELGTHAEFLGICSRQEMLAEFFVHDGGDTQTWRLKGHAQTQFWRWVATWAAAVRKPSDLGFDDSRYILPPLVTHQHTIAAPADAAERMGQLFAMEAQTLSERRTARRVSMSERVQACATVVDADPQSWIIWVELNDEQDELERLLGKRAFSVRGSMTPDEKESQILGWLAGERPIMISKASIMGWGINAQHCARMAFVGVTDSFESYYQAVRRCWRFGQTREVHVHVFSSELEGAVVKNVRRKEADAAAMAEALSAETRAAVLEATGGQTRTTNTYRPAARVLAPAWLRSEAA